MSAWGMLKEGKVGDAIQRVVETVFGVSMPKPLSDLVHRLVSDEGNVAYQVAKDAWDNWNDGEDLLTIAQKAAAEALSKGLSVAEQDVADWLGILDRQAA